MPALPAVRRRFDYAVPADHEDRIRVGSRVRIDLHGRRVAGWVVEDGVEPPPAVEVKPLAGSSGEGPPSAVVALAEWAAWRWAGPVSSFLGTASPPTVVRGSGTPSADGAVPSRTARRAVPPSPGGGAVRLVAEALAVPGVPAVVRLAPALDATLVVLELVHRLGTSGLLVLAPSRAGASRLRDRLAGAGIPTALLPDQWELASSGEVVVVGARAAAWAPVEHLAGAVVLDAHSDAYREQRAPTWSAVEVVTERARRGGVPAVHVSPCPPVTLTEGARLVTAGRALERRGWPVVEVVDRSADDPRTGLVSERLARLLHDVLARPGGRVVCVLDRTGRIRLLACASCGELVRCTRCGGAMSQGAAGEALTCRRCGDARPGVCAVCDSSRLKALRIGVGRATEEISALAGVEAEEVTGSAAPAVPTGARLVVGTEAALHRVGRADAVAFLDFDQHLLAPRFGAGEESLALLALAARLVGSRDGNGRLLVQTRLPGHDVLRAAGRADPGLLAGPERALRAGLDLPPFGALSVLRGPGAPRLAAELGTHRPLSVAALDEGAWLVRAGTTGPSATPWPRPTVRPSGCGSRSTRPTCDRRSPLPGALHWGHGPLRRADLRRPRAPSSPPARSTRSTGAWPAWSTTWSRPCTTPRGRGSPLLRSGCRSVCSSTTWGKAPRR